MAEIEKIVKNRLFDILQYQKENYPREDALCDKKTGEWRKYSTDQLIDAVDKFSLGLLNMGFGKGDKFAIISYNRTEWTITDLGILQMGGIDVPMYPNISEENYEYIFNDAKVKLVFVENKELYDKVMHVLPNCPSVQKIFTFEKIEGLNHYSEIPEVADESLRERLNEIKESIDEFDLATIIYTSGTTGVPKGVMLSHHNIMSNAVEIKNSMPHRNNHRFISFLPICHIFERTAVYFYLLVGGAIYFAESIDKVGDNLKEIKPHYFTCVPRLLEKIYEKIMAKGRELSGAKKAIFGWALQLGNQYHPKGENSAWYNFKLGIARKLVFSKWLEALGGEVEGIISGSASLQPRLGRIFTAAGINVIEGYGLTETSPVLTCNRFTKGDNYIGTVGLPLPSVQIKLAETGEILAKGPNVMMGYYNKPEETKKVIDEEGWFHTGDVGEWVEGRFLKITDRVKEIFKTSGGKYVAPLPIENKMKESFFIEQMMVIGENRKFTSALVVPNFAFIRDWSVKKGLNLKTNEEIIKSQEVRDRIWEEIQKYNERFGHIQQVKKFELVPEEWSVESGELTPTLKLKRRIILEKYKDLIDSMYE
ncbi:MAG: long-chain fatty acid--CoA ligase [Ignavibacteria bacterium]|nr:MAG: long-chain fatty acid--CoA ligase [Ignavibacteria bacterium]